LRAQSSAPAPAAAGPAGAPVVQLTERPRAVRSLNVPAASPSCRANNFQDGQLVHELPSMCALAGALRGEREHRVSSNTRFPGRPLGLAGRGAAGRSEAREAVSERAGGPPTAPVSLPAASGL